MDTYKQHEALGRNTAITGTSPSDLEAKLGSFLFTNSLSNDNTKAVAAGYIGQMLQTEQSPVVLRGLYHLLHGFCRRLYSTSFANAEALLLERIAQDTKEYSDRRRDMITFLKAEGDIAALNSVAEIHLEDSPALTLEWATGDKRQDLLKAIVDRYESEAVHKEAVKNAMKELGDKEGVRRVARANLKAIRFSSPILEQIGREDDLYELVQVLKDTDIPYAYKLSMRLKAHPCRDVQQKNLKWLLIEKHPGIAFQKFTELVPPSMSKNNLVSKDDASIIAIGKRYHAIGDPLNALYAFEVVGYEGEEYIQIGIALLRNDLVTSDLSATVNARIDHAKRAAALRYFQEGGSAVTSDYYLNMEVGDEVNHTLAVELYLKSIDEQNLKLACRAYQRFMAIRTKAVNPGYLPALRLSLASNGELNVFKENRDYTGLCLLIDLNKSTKPGIAYEAAMCLGDKQLIQEARMRLVQDVTQDPNYVKGIFQRANDAEGIAYLQERLSQGVKRGIVNDLLGLENVCAARST